VDLLRGTTRNALHGAANRAENQVMSHAGQLAYLKGTRDEAVSRIRDTVSRHSDNPALHEKMLGRLHKNQVAPLEAQLTQAEGLTSGLNKAHTQARDLAAQEASKVRMARGVAGVGAAGLAAGAGVAGHNYLAQNQ
jgi:hypothetical protein